MKLYTRTGDGGETSLFDNTRISKADPRIDAYGEVDELCAWIGLVRASLVDSSIHGALDQIQRDLFALGAQLADPSHRISGRVVKAILSDEDVGRLERLIDEHELSLPPLTKFLLPGGSPPGAALHVARTICRRAERRIVALVPPVEPVLVRYINRLSDLLFVLARSVNVGAGVREIEW